MARIESAVPENQPGGQHRIEQNLARVDPLLTCVRRQQDVPFGNHCSTATSGI
jgi:hypothetical protein